jgi:hypothetical protein
MAHIGQFGTYYMQVVDRFYHALEWRYNDVQGRSGHERESEILAKLLDMLIADQVMHDIMLGNIEAALRVFQKVRFDSYSPNKYKEVLFLLHVEENETLGYTPHLFGNIVFEARHQA